MLYPAQRVCSGNGDTYQGFQERLSTMCSAQMHHACDPRTLYTGAFA